MTAQHPFADAKVAAVFAALPDGVRDPLMRLRALIFETAAQTPRVGAIVETLKWGEPAYLPKRPRIGTTIRINALKNAPGGYAVYFHCQTSLIGTFRHLYPDIFTFDGNRAVLFSVDDVLPVEALGHCIALALTYHLGRSPPISSEITRS